MKTKVIFKFQLFLKARYFARIVSEPIAYGSN